MRLHGPGTKPNRTPLVKGLIFCSIFTLLLAIACAVYYSLMSGYSAVIDTDQIELIQLDSPKEGAPIAVMHTTAGDMTYVLYPEQCPQTVANFTALAESGHYDNTYVFRVEQNVFFSAGAENADGTVSQPDADCEQIEQELSPKLWPLRGALCALTSKTDGGFFRILTNKQKYYTGSRFLVVNSIEMTDEIREGMLSEDNSEAQNLLANAFLDHGGIPNYSQQITVFGQLIDGYDILDAITGVELTGEENAMRPAEDILITGIEITQYAGN